MLLGTVLAFAMLPMSGPAQESGPYKVLKRPRVGGEGGWDYIYADSAGRRLCIPRRGSPAAAATDTRPTANAIPTRLSLYDLDTLELIGEIAGVGGNGTAVDPKTGWLHRQPAGVDVRYKIEDADQDD